MENNSNTLDFYELLSEKHPSITSASSEIINLKAIMSLPKGTEHFISDIHGEFEEFSHILKNGSGVIKRKINDLFNEKISDFEKRQLSTIIYYPEKTLKLIDEQTKSFEWYKDTLQRLIMVCRLISSKYTRSKVRKALPKNFAYIIEELLREQENNVDKQAYYNEIINTIIETGQAKNFIIAISNLIQHLSIDHLHIVGDIYDRGPDADKIMDKLMTFTNIDIQFGNHDILWIGAALGSKVCVANVIRLALKHKNTKTIKEGYSIKLNALSKFANEAYRGDEAFEFQTLKKSSLKSRRMQKAITIIQLKLEAQIINRRPEFEMNDRLLLERINQTDHTIMIGSTIHKLKTDSWPTLGDDTSLTEQEQALIDQLTNQFMTSTRLKTHVDFLFSKGSIYTVFNNNILIHGCIPLEDEKSYSSFTIDGTPYRGVQLLDKFNELIRGCYYQEQDHLDYFFYLWQGAKSPLYGRDKMTTFERYFIEDKSTWKESKNAYFDFRNSTGIVREILTDFGLNADTGHIINGHQPVKAIDGEDPVKAEGKVIVIDGGFFEAYQPVTGIKGYTLISNSFGLLLVEHREFISTYHAITHYQDIISEGRILELNDKRTLVKETDIGKNIISKIDDLNMLIRLYESGKIKQKKA